MSYSTNPVLDADRYFEQQDRYQEAVQASQRMYEELFLAAAMTGDGAAITHADAETVRQNGAGGVSIKTILLPLSKTMQQLCECSDAGALAMQALLTCAKSGHPQAVAAINALAREYGEQKGAA